MHKIILLSVFTLINVSITLADINDCLSTHLIGHWIVQYSTDWCDITGEYFFSDSTVIYVESTYSSDPHIEDRYMESEQKWTIESENEIDNEIVIHVTYSDSSWSKYTLVFNDDRDIITHTHHVIHFYYPPTTWQPDGHYTHVEYDVDDDQDKIWVRAE